MRLRLQRWTPRSEPAVMGNASTWMKRALAELSYLLPL